MNITIKVKDLVTWLDWYSAYPHLILSITKHTLLYLKNLLCFFKKADDS